MFEDKTLICKDCGSEFVFTAGEQEFYAEKGFQNEPARCKDCRDSRKANSRRTNGSNGKRQMYDAVCAECGPKYPLNQRTTDQYIAAIATRPGDNPQARVPSVNIE